MFAADVHEAARLPPVMQFKPQEVMPMTCLCLALGVELT
jgi:hypothetical protein